VKFFPLVWAGLWRRPVRSILTAICIAIAFVLLGLLQGVNAGFERAIAGSQRDLLTTRPRVRGGAFMPVSAMDEIRKIPGVKEVTLRAYFMGIIGDTDGVAAIATEPDIYFRLLPRIIPTREGLAALRTTRNGIPIFTPCRAPRSPTTSDHSSFTLRTLPSIKPGTASSVAGELSSASSNLFVALSCTSTSARACGSAFCVVFT